MPRILYFHKSAVKKLCLLFLLLLLLPIISCGKTQSDNKLIVDILDVGKADCIIIRSDKKTVMIDTGEEENLPEIEAYLSANNIETIDLLILSHFDKDHIGGAERIISICDVIQIVESHFISERDEYTNYHNAAEDKGIAISKLKENASFNLGDAVIEIDTPKQAAYEKKEDNNASLIVSMNYKETNFLFCGDALEERMSEFLLGKKLSFDLAKLPHHGSYLKNYEDILSLLNINVAVICNSQKNPTAEKLSSLLNKKDIDFYETRYGSIQIRSDGKNISIEQ